MSFQHSRPIPTPAEHRDALRDALVEVAESSFFAFVEPCDTARFRELGTGVPSWMQSSVLFEGAFGGAMQVVLPESLARDLFAAFLGAEPGVVAMDGPLFDLVGEFANMTCGSWLTRACHRRTFTLHHPEVSRLRAEQVQPEHEDCMLLVVNEQPCYVRLAFAGE